MSAVRGGFLREIFEALFWPKMGVFGTFGGFRKSGVFGHFLANMEYVTLFGEYFGQLTKKYYKNYEKL